MRRLVCWFFGHALVLEKRQCGLGLYVQRLRCIRCGMADPYLPADRFGL